jgi:hypothetical protein
VRPKLFLFDLAEELQAAHPGHIDVRQNQDSPMCKVIQVNQGFFSGIGKNKVRLTISDFFSEALFEKGFHVLLVIDY